MLTFRVDRRAGFTLVELVVVLVVLAALAAVITPQVVGRLVDSEVGALSQNLSGVANGIERFRGDVGRYPDSINHLVSLPATARDVCALVVIPAAFRAEWSGPYLGREITPAGILSGNSAIRRDLTRNPATSSSSSPNGTLTITTDGVDLATANGLEAAFDGNATLTAGTIRWTVVAGTPGRGTLFYDIPIRGC